MQATATPVAVSPRDTTSISGAAPVERFDFDGNAVGTIPIPDFRPVQDLAYDPDSGNLYALRVDPNTSVSFISNLTTDTTVTASGLSLFMDRDTDMAIYNGVIAVSPQDTNFTTSAPPVSLFDFDGNAIGSFPIADFRAVQDLAFDPDSGDLFALRAVPNTTTGIISNLTTGADVVAQGLALYMNRSADLSIHDGVIAISPQDLNFTTTGAPPVSLFDFTGTAIGSIPIPDEMPVQDIVHDLTSGDLYALRADPSGGTGILSNLTTGTHVPTQGLVVPLDVSTDLAVQPTEAPEGVPTPATLWLLCVGVAGFGCRRRFRIA